MKLTLSGWESHRSLTLDLRAPVTILCGPNAIGKTAIVDGLEFLALGTGLLRGIKTKAALARYSIHDKHQEAQVGLKLGDLSALRLMDREGDQTLELDGRTEPKLTKGQAALLERLGVDSLRARAAIDAEATLRQDADKRRAVIFGAAGTEATKGEVLEAFVRCSLQGEDVAAYAETAVSRGFREAEEMAKTARASKTRAIEELERGGAPDSLFRPTWSRQAIDLTGLSIEEITRREKLYEESLGKAERETGETKGAAQATLEAARMELGDVRQRVEEASLPELEPLRQAEAEGQTEAERLRAEISGFEAQIAAHEELLAEPDEPTKPEACPVIAGCPPCPMTKAKLEKHAAAYAGARSQTRVDLAGAQESLEKARQRLDATELDLGVATERLEGAEELYAEQEGRKERLPGLEAAVVDAEEALAQAGEEPEPESSPAFFKGRLENTRNLRSAKERYDQRVEDQTNSARRIEELRDERERIDAIAQALKPTGIETLLLEARAKPLQEAFDEWTGRKDVKAPKPADGFLPPVRMTAEGEVEIYEERAERWRAYVQASESYRMRLAYALQHAIAKVAGFPFLILDRFDHLDPPGRAGVLTAARRVAPHYPGGVLLLATLGREEPTPTPFEDVETLWLRGDQIERVG